jgi:hypothetical protein
MAPPPPHVVRLFFVVAVMQIMMGQLRLFAKLACIEHDCIQYEMEQQRKRCHKQLEEQLLECLEADHLVCRDENSNPIPRKKQRASRFPWDQARLAIQHNFYGPNPVFDNRLFARFYNGSQATCVCCKPGSMVPGAKCWRNVPLWIDPKAKLLLA